MNQKRRTAHEFKVPLKYLFEGGGGGGYEAEPPTKFSKGEELARPQFIEEGCWEREG